MKGPEPTHRDDHGVSPGRAARAVALGVCTRIDANLKILRRQPWFVATLSWLFPGAGQLFSGAYWRGLGFILLTVFFHAVFVLSCIRSDMSFLACVGLHLCAIVLPATWAACDAYKLASVAKDSAVAETPPSDAPSYFSAFLSTILPGLGQAYLHRWLWAAVYLSLYVVFRRLSIYTPFGRFAVTLAAYTVSAVHAYAMDTHGSKKRRRSLLPLVASLIAVCLALQGLVVTCRGIFFVGFSRPFGISMARTITQADRMVFDRLAYVLDDPVPGDIVLFHAPEHPRASNAMRVFKRIVAVGGETIELRDGRIWVDGQSREIRIGGYGYPTPGTLRSAHWDATDGSSARYAVEAPYRVPDNHYFVLGDNRSYSLDSRHYGAIPRQSIVGRVTKCWCWTRGTRVFRSVENRAD